MSERSQLQPAAGLSNVQPAGWSGLQLGCSAAAASSLTNLPSAILPAHAAPLPQSLGCPVRELFLLVPAISRWQWHPITVAGAEADPSGTGSLLTLHIKRYGRWTAELLRLLKRPNPLALRVSGTLAPPRHARARCMHAVDRRLVPARWHLASRLWAAVCMNQVTHQMRRMPAGRAALFQSVQRPQL